MRSWLAGALALVLTPATFAGFAFGDLLFNPQLTGTGAIGDGAATYVSGLPAWLVPGNLALTLNSPIQGIPGLPQFNGFVDSYAYNIPGGTIGLAYRIRLSNTGAQRLVRASLGAEGWFSPAIPAAGADGSGLSAAQGAVSWIDGDPYYLERDFLGGNPMWQFRLGSNGTVLNRNQRSALIWFETSATSFSENTITLQDGGVVGAARVLSLPEPTSAALLLTMAGTAVLARRRS